MDLSRSCSPYWNGVGYFLRGSCCIHLDLVGYLYLAPVQLWGVHSITKAHSNTMPHDSSPNFSPTSRPSTSTCSYMGLTVSNIWYRIWYMACGIWYMKTGLLERMVSEIPLILGLRARLQDPCVVCGFWGKASSPMALHHLQNGGP